MSGSGWLSAASLGKRGRPQTPAAAPAVTQTSPAPDPKQPQRGRHLPHRGCGSGWLCRGAGGGVSGKVTAARARACRALVCAVGLCILTPCHGMTAVSLTSVRCRHRNRPPGKQRDLTHALLPPHPHCQHPSATPQPSGLRQDTAPLVCGKASCKLAKGLDPAQRPPRPFPVSLLLSLAAQRGAATLWV